MLFSVPLVTMLATILFASSAMAAPGSADVALIKALSGLWADSPAWKKLFGLPTQDPPHCAEDFDRKYMMNISPDRTWEACYMPGTYVWMQDDVETAKCLIDLHYRQNSACISVKGSRCDAIKGTSKILNIRKAVISFNGKVENFSAGESGALQAAVSSMLGMSMGAGPGRDSLNSFKSDLEPDKPGLARGMWIRFGGGQQC